MKKMKKTNFYQMEEESQKIASEQQEYIAIVSDRYEQDMKKTVSNIKEEVEKAESPYLSPNVDSRGKDLAPIFS